MATNVIPQIKIASQDQKVQDCVIYIEQPSLKVTKNLLSICQRICQVQLISDLFLNKVSGRHRTEDDTFVMSRDAQTVWIHQCNFTLNFWQCFLSSLSVTRNLTTLDLSHVILGNAGRHLATSFQAWGPSSPLRTLILCDVFITVPDWGKLCESFTVCQNLTHLDLSQNILGKSGRQLACSMQSWGFHLEIANFEGCCLKADASRDIIKHLSGCKNLNILNLSGNILTGCLPSLLKEPYPGLALLRTVKLNECELSRDDIVHMTSLVNRGQLPALVRLEQECNSFYKIENELGELLESILTNQKGNLRLEFKDNKLSREFKLKWERLLWRTPTIWALGKNELTPLTPIVEPHCKTHSNVTLELEDTVPFESGAIPIRCKESESGEFDETLTKLDLDQCLQTERSKTILSDLTMCKNLIHLNLSNNSLNEAGRHIPVAIREWGQCPPLQKLYLNNCSMPVNVWCDLFEALQTCRCLLHLEVSQNKLDIAGSLLTQAIKFWGKKAPVQNLNFESCCMTEDVWRPLLRSLSNCSELTHLNLSNNALGVAGRYLSESITSWGNDPKLQEVDLRNCSMPLDVWSEVLKCLSSCRRLTHLKLSSNSLQEAARCLGESIKRWGCETELTHLHLAHCSMQQEVSRDVVKSLSACKSVTSIDLSGNWLGDAGTELTDSIRSWGACPPLQDLWLNDCSLEQQSCNQIFTALYTCRYLKHLSLSNNNLGRAGYQLAQLIKSAELQLKILVLENCGIPGPVWREVLESVSTSNQLTCLKLCNNQIGNAACKLAQTINHWGTEARLNILDLTNCSIPEDTFETLFDALSSCPDICLLSLSGNTVGRPGINLADSIASWGTASNLRELTMSSCGMPEDIWCQLLSSMSHCKLLSLLNLEDNPLGDAGYSLAQAIRAWGPVPPLNKLSINNCCLSQDVSSELLKALSSCALLTHLDLSRNTLTGGLRCLFPESSETAKFLESLNMAEASLDCEDLQCLARLVRRNGLQQMNHINLSFNNFSALEGELGDFLEACVTCYKSTLTMQMWFNSLSENFKRMWGGDSRNENIKLQFGVEKIGPLNFYNLSGHRIHSDHINAILSVGGTLPFNFLSLSHCSMTQDLCSMLLRALSVCRDLIYLDLSDNDLEDAAFKLADSIRSWGEKPPLQELNLARCSIPEKVLGEIVKALSGCKELQTLNIKNANFGETGHLLASTIRSWGDNPSLEVLDLANSTISVDSSTELMKSLSTCKCLKSLLLSKIRLQGIGKSMAQLVQSWGPGAPLEKLRLDQCSMDEKDCRELLQSLANCNSLLDIDLSGNPLGDAGNQLAKCFLLWRNNAPLQKLQLSNCSMSVQVWYDLMKHVAILKNLTHLDLSKNNLNETGRQFGKSISCWGDCPQLSVLDLEKCTMPENVWSELLEALSSCKQITNMNLSQNTIGASGQNLAKCIKSWGALQTLNLKCCGMSIDNWNIVLQSLVTCKKMTCLVLSDNSLNESAEHLVELLRSWGEDTCLEVLSLWKCSLSPDVCTDLFRVLKASPKLILLELSFNDLEVSGHELARTIRCWGPNPALRMLALRNCSLTEEACSELIDSLENCKSLTALDITGSHLCKNGLKLKRYLESITQTLAVLCLDRCSIPADVCDQIVSVLSSCKNMRHFSLPGNTLTGIFSNFVPHPCLDNLDLSDSSLSKNDLKHLTDLTEQKKVPHLSELWLIGNSLKKAEKELEQFLDVCLKCHQRELKIFLFRNNLSEDFIHHWSTKCKGTLINLDFERDVDP